MKKRVTLIIVALTALLSLIAASASAASEIKVILDGKALSFDVPPRIINDRTLVPLRAIFEGMGATIDYEPVTQTVTSKKGDTVVVLTIGSTSPTINGKAVTIDQPGIIVDGRTLAPLRFVAEAFGGTVVWDGDSQTATITTGGASKAPATTTPAAPATASTAPAGETPASDGEPTLIGKWAAFPDYTMEDYGGVEFKSDGTFVFISYDVSLQMSISESSSESDFTLKGKIVQKGDYSVKDNKISFANVTESVDGGSSKPVDAFTWRFKFETSRGEYLDQDYPNTTWLVVQPYDGNSDFSMWLAKLSAK